MLHVVINQHHLILKAATPDTVARVARILKDALLPQTGTSAPANYFLKGVVCVFGQGESPDAGKMVLKKIEEAEKDQSLKTETLKAELANAVGEIKSHVTLALSSEQAGNETITTDSTAGILREIHHEIALVREEQNALRLAKARLEQMQSEKLFAFTNKIDAESFRIVCAVLAQGDVAKASRALNLADATLRKRIARWPARGPAYRVLADLVRWRKAMGARGTVLLNEAITHGTAAPADYAGLLSDVLDELLAMNEENWEEKADALAALLRPYVTR